MFKKNLKKYYNITRNRVDYLSFQGKILLKKEKFKEAIIILRDAISLILTKRHYNYNIVAELYRDLAVAYSKLNSDRYGLKMNLCSIKYYEGSKNKDKRDLKNYINALLSAINIYFKYNKYEKAKNHINKILKYDKNNFKAIYFLAVIYYKENDLKNAEKFIIKALRLCKNTEIKLELYYWLVRIYLISEQTSRAYRYLLKGTKISYSFYLKYSWPNNTFSNYTKNKYLLFLSKCEFAN